jgi:CheY-like chemotaxis protein
MAEKDKFFSIIAHDLRGPMGGFMQLTELMANEEEGLREDEIKEMTMHLSHSAKNTFNLLENLLEWSQIDRGFSDFNLEKIGLNKVVTDCISVLAEQARGKGIELVCKIPNEHEVIADKNMLQTVIRNLISNAIKFTKQGGMVTISAKSIENNHTLVSVQDTGIGMTEELKNKLFRIDANAKRPGTDGELSTGLGLLLCKEFVEKQGGKISVESEQKVGSVFSFTIPSADSLPRQNEVETIVRDETKKSSPKNLNILIAEDDDISAILLSIMSKGFINQSFRARTGVEAVEVFRNNPGIDLVMMDLKMPGVDGYEAARQIRLISQDVVILAQTTFAMPGDREIAIEAGCTDYLTKPLHADLFFEMVQKYVKNKLG